MTEQFIKEIRSIESFSNSIINSIVLDSGKKLVTVKLVTDKVFTEENRVAAEKTVRAYVPEFFRCMLEISKLTPDCEMVKNKIAEALNNNFRAVSVTLGKQDIKVKKSESGFEYIIYVMPSLISNGI